VADESASGAATRRRSRAKPPPWGKVDNRATLLALTFGLATLVAIYLAIVIWPAAVTGADIERTALTGGEVATLKMPTVSIFGSSYTPNQANIALLVAVIFGFLGACLNSAWVVSVRVGTRRVDGSWLVWNGLAPVFGTGLALLVHLTFSAGLFGVGYDEATLEPATIAVICGAAGMSSTPIRRWLQDAFKKQLSDAKQKEAGGGSAGESGAVAAATAPMITSVDPATVGMGVPSVVTVTGEGFDESATLDIDGVLCEVERGEKQLSTTLTDADVSVAGLRSITVTTNAGAASSSFEVIT
jgi:hypothetical protein